MSTAHDGPGTGVFCANVRSQRRLDDFGGIRITYVADGVKSAKSDSGVDLRSTSVASGIGAVTSGCMGN